jgi:hypothetical protein
LETSEQILEASELLSLKKIQNFNFSRHSCFLLNASVRTKADICCKYQLADLEQENYSDIHAAEDG